MEYRRIFGPLTKGEAIAAHEAALRQYQAAVQRIMEQSRGDPPEGGGFEIVQRVSLEEDLKKHPRTNAEHPIILDAKKLFFDLGQRFRYLF